MSQPLRFGLIGCGHHGKHFGKFLRVTENEPLGVIVAVSDIDQELLARVAEQICSRVALHQYPCYKDLLNHTALDAVIVSTPADVRQPVIDALNAGIHVYCANPLALNFPLANEICSLAESKNLVCTVDDQWPFLPGVKLTEVWYGAGKIGELRRVVIGGKGRHALREEIPRIGSHLLAVCIRHFTGSVTSIHRFCSSDGADVHAILETDSGIPIDAQFYQNQYDVGRCFIELHGTTRRLRAIGGFLENVHYSPYPYDTATEATSGYGGPSIWVRQPVGKVWSIGQGQEDEALTDPDMNPTFWLLEQFCLAVRGQADNPYSPRRFLPVALALSMLLG